MGSEMCIRDRSPDRSMIIITHHPKLLELVRPDFVHVLTGGKIVRSGGPELATEIEAQGYLTGAAAPA